MDEIHRYLMAIKRIFKLWFVWKSTASSAVKEATKAFKIHLFRQLGMVLENLMTHQFVITGYFSSHLFAKCFCFLSLCKLISFRYRNGPAKPRLNPVILFHLLRCADTQHHCPSTQVLCNGYAAIDRVETIFLIWWTQRRLHVCDWAAQNHFTKMVL